MKLSLGQIAFEAYARILTQRYNVVPSKPVDWSTVSKMEQDGWETAAQAVFDEVMTKD